MTAVTHSHQVLIRAGLQVVFDYVSDLTRHPEWNGGLRIEELTPNPIGVGKEYASRGEVLVQKGRPNTLRVYQYSPPFAFGFVARDPNVGDVSHLFTFAERDGGVLVTRTMTVDLHPIIALGFRYLVYPLIGGPSMERSFAELKVKLEQKK